MEKNAARKEPVAKLLGFAPVFLDIMDLIATNVIVQFPITIDLACISSAMVRVHAIIKQDVANAMRTGTCLTVLAQRALYLPET